MAEENKDSWKLDKIELEMQSFGENKGKYEGRVRFSNGHYESFSFRAQPEMAKKYINLIAEDIVESAERLGKDLVESLGLNK